MPSSTEPMPGTAMPHKYKRRTLFEAQEIAWEKFSKEVTTHLSADEIADYLAIPSPKKEIGGDVV